MNASFDSPINLHSFLDSYEFEEIKAAKLDGVYIIMGHPQDRSSSTRGPGYNVATRIFKVGKWVANKSRLNAYYDLYGKKGELVYLSTSKPRAWYDRSDPVVNMKEKALKSFLRGHSRVKLRKRTEETFEASINTMEDAIEYMDRNYKKEKFKSKWDSDDGLVYSKRIVNQYTKMFDKGVEAYRDIRRESHPLSQGVKNKLENYKSEAYSDVTGRSY